MAAGEGADQRLGMALDRIAARLALPFAGGDIGIELGVAETLEGDDGRREAVAGNAFGIDERHRRMDAVPPSGKRSDERRVGKECVSSFKSRWSPCHQKKNKTNL